jgi:hypothetical protein
VVTQARRRIRSYPDGKGGWQRPLGFIFDAGLCAACELRESCTASKKGQGRTVSLHPQEALLQQARALQKSAAFGEYKKRRQVSEHRIARLVHLGIRQARYFGRAKTRFQLLMAATVANLTLVARATGMMRSPHIRAISHMTGLCRDILAGLKTFIVHRRQLLAFSWPSHRFQHTILVAARVSG